MIVNGEWWVIVQENHQALKKVCELNEY